MNRFELVPWSFIIAFEQIRHLEGKYLVLVGRWGIEKYFIGVPGFIHFFFQPVDVLFLGRVQPDARMMGKEMNIKEIRGFSRLMK